MAQGVAYESAVFEARNDATARRIYFTYATSTASVSTPVAPKPASPKAYYQTTLDQAHLYTSINGIPSPIVVTDWKYK